MYWRCVLFCIFRSFDKITATMKWKQIQNNFNAIRQQTVQNANDELKGKGKKSNRAPNANKDFIICYYHFTGSNGAKNQLDIHLRLWGLYACLDDV